jgi:hypothetical protein
MQSSPTDIEIWFHYEEIAMHFNNLIMQFRLQLMGGAGVIGTVAAYLIGGKVNDPGQRHWLRFLVSSGLLVLIIAAAVLDLAYYDRLLKGAVAALLEFEKNHPDIQMSTRIEQTVGWGKYSIWGVYAFLFVALGGFTTWSAQQHFLGRRRPR